jgi:hypothetical protein
MGKSEPLPNKLYHDLHGLLGNLKDGVEGLSAETDRAARLGWLTLIERCADRCGKLLERLDRSQAE